MWRKHTIGIMPLEERTHDDSGHDDDDNSADDVDIDEKVRTSVGLLGVGD